MPSFNIPSGIDGLYLILTYTVEQYSIESNTTPVTISLQIHHGGLQVGAGTDDCEVHVGSQSYKWTGPDIYSSGGTEDLGSHRFVVPHNPDGTWSGEIGGAYRLGIIYGSHGYVGTIQGGQTIALPTIPRASSISATSTYIGERSTVVISRMSSTFTHTVRYDFGSLTGYIAKDGTAVTSPVKLTDTTVLFAIPDAFYGQIPDSPTGTCVLTCTTYSGSEQVGTETQALFTVRVLQEAAGPIVTGTVQDVNSLTVLLTGDDSKLVRFKSTAQCTIEATPRKSSTLEYRRVSGVEYSQNVSVVNFTEVQAGSFVFSAKDSRKFVTEYPVEKEMIPYIKLTCNAYGYRLTPTDGTARIDVSGQWYNGSFGAQTNELTLRYKIGEDGAWSAATPVIPEGENKYTAQIDLTGLDYTQEFEITVEASDKLDTASKLVTIRKGIPVFDWGENDFSFNVPVSISEGIIGLVTFKGGVSGNTTFEDSVDIKKGCSVAGNLDLTNNVDTSYPMPYATIGNAGKWKLMGYGENYNYVTGLIPNADGRQFAIWSIDYQKGILITSSNSGFSMTIDGNAVLHSGNHANASDLLLNWTTLANNSSVQFAASKSYYAYVVYSYVGNAFFSSTVCTHMLTQPMCVCSQGENYPFTLSRSGDTCTLNRSGTSAVSYLVLGLR